MQWVFDYLKIACRGLLCLFTCVREVWTFSRLMWSIVQGRVEKCSPESICLEFS